MPIKHLNHGGKPIITASTVEPGDVVNTGGGTPVTVIDVARSEPGPDGGHHATVWFDQALSPGLGNRLDLKPGHYLDYVDHIAGVSAIDPDQPYYRPMVSAEE